MITDQQRKLIHHAKRRLNMTEPDYRAMLQRVAGVTSSNDLDDAGVTAVMAEFGRLGFIPDATSKPPGGRSPGRPTKKQWGLVYKLAKEKGYTGLDDPGLATLCSNVAKVDSLRFLDQSGISKLILALENWIDWEKKHHAQ